MHYKFHKASFKRGSLYKKSKINPQHEDDKCFQYASTVALNYKEIESHPERVSNIEPFINK